MISSEWEGREAFRMIPITGDCPYVEGIFDTETKVLVLFLKESKESFHMIPRVDENGDPVPVGKGKPRMNGKPYREERKTIQTFHEYYITDKAEIKSFLEMFSINYDTFNSNKYFETQAVLA
jgi:hypothetical protein